MFWATTTMRHERYHFIDETNVLGEYIEGEFVPVNESLPASVVEDRQDRFGLADLRQQKVEYYSVRLPLRTDITEGDRLVDLSTNYVHQVVGVSNTQSTTGMGSVRVATKRVGTAG